MILVCSGMAARSESGKLFDCSPWFFGNAEAVAAREIGGVPSRPDPESSDYTIIEDGDAIRWADALERCQPHQWRDFIDFLRNCGGFSYAL